MINSSNFSRSNAQIIKYPIITDKDVVIAISQSGETADTMAALKLAKEKKYEIGYAHALLKKEDIFIVFFFNMRDKTLNTEKYGYRCTTKPQSKKHIKYRVIRNYFDYCYNSLKHKIKDDSIKREQ